MIATLVAHDHFPTSEDLEFAGMADGKGDLIFNVLCMDSEWVLSSPVGSKEEPFGDEDDEDRLTSVAPSTVPAKWGTMHARSRRDCQP